jgi:DNA-3-methyladenine glycosylase I
MTKEKVRCGQSWYNSDFFDYHDKELGVPVWDDRLLYEKLMLSNYLQTHFGRDVHSRALGTRETFRTAFVGFDPYVISKYQSEEIRSLKRILKQDPLASLSRDMVEAAIENAKGFLTIMEAEVSFAKFLWGFVNDQPIHHWQNLHPPDKTPPSKSPESEAMSTALKEHGFRLCSPTQCYNFMQDAGLVNGHTTDCFRFKEIKQMLMR